MQNATAALAATALAAPAARMMPREALLSAAMFGCGERKRCLRQRYSAVQRQPAPTAVGAPDASDTSRRTATSPRRRGMLLNMWITHFGHALSLAVATVVARIIERVD